MTVDGGASEGTAADRSELSQQGPGSYDLIECKQLERCLVGGSSLAHPTLTEYLMISEHWAGGWRQKEYEHTLTVLKEIQGQGGNQYVSEALE